MLGPDDVAQYLQRIGVAEPVEAPSADALRALVRAHALAIPFENLDIILRRPPRYEVPALLEKIVHGRRGGWCYELNLLFHQLLQALGFQARLASGRVFRDGVLQPEFDHLVPLVELPDGLWMADVGFGDYVPALPVRHGAEDTGTGDVQVRLVALAGQPGWAVEQCSVKGDERVSTFTTDAHPFERFLERSEHLRTSPESSYTRHLMCMKPLRNGAYAIVWDGNLVVSMGGNQTRCPLAQPSQVRAALRDGFGVDVTDEEAEALFAHRPPA